MSKPISKIKLVSITYLYICLSSVITSLIYFIYIYITGFQGDVGAFYTVVLYFVGGLILSFISLLLYGAIFYILHLNFVIPPIILVISLILLGTISIGIWGYGDYLLHNGTISRHQFISFGFYSPEELEIIMHAIYYILMGVIIRIKLGKNKN